MAEKPVALTDAAAKALVDAVVQGVTKQREADLLEQFKSFARQEMELAEARREIERKNAEIAGLRSHITTLNGFVASMAPGNGHPVFPTPSPALAAFPNGYSTPAPAPQPPLVFPPVPQPSSEPSA